MATAMKKHGVMYRAYSPSAMTSTHIKVMETSGAIRKGAREYNVPESTLRNRIRGHVDPDTMRSGPEAIFSQEEEDIDAQVTFEDQQKINEFARVNVKLQDLKSELTEKQKELQNLEDAGDELLMQDDDDATIPYQIGQVFVCMNSEETTEMLEKTKVVTKEEIKTLEKHAEQHKTILQDLKVELYAKFGTNINLEAEEE